MSQDDRTPYTRGYDAFINREPECPYNRTLQPAECNEFEVGWLDAYDDACRADPDIGYGPF